MIRLAAPKATPINHGESFIVSGTPDVDAARAAVADWAHALPFMDEDWIDPDTASKLRPTRIGLFRWNPCSPRSCWDGGGHCGHLQPVDQHGPGVFEGVYLEW